jgi:signal transduction histidine kinase
LVKLLRYQLDPKVAVTTNVPEHIYCRLPESGFRHVLLNLVMNAAQAIGEAPGTIEIAAAVKRGHVELSISDDGPGFPQELLRAGVHEHGTWRKGGSGLGLATARRFMLEHGSRLELKQRQEGGAVVAMTLPAEDCDE